MPKAKAEEPTFESALQRLEEIVEAMEAGELPLDDLIARYEEGMGHLKFCEEKLKRAEQKIEKLMRTAEEAAGTGESPAGGPDLL
jgi:exodeoxyribonuclease VII small subunit